MKSNSSACYSAKGQRLSQKGFSLVEVLVSMAILSIMMAAAATMLSQTQSIWTKTWSRATQFRDARLGFELVTRNLSQSTLNTYWDYENDRNGDPTDYQRRSELHFYTSPTKDILPGSPSTTHCIFFQAILGYSRNSEFQQLDTLLNGRGYYINFGKDDFQKPNFISSLDSQPEPIWRYRLMEYLPPSEKNLIYQADLANRNNGTSMNAWFAPNLIAEHSRPVVDNVIAMIISPQKSPDEDGDPDDVYTIAPNYSYDSRDSAKPESFNLVPPLVQVTFVVLSDPSAVRLQEIHGESPPELLNASWFQDADKFDEDLKALEVDFQEKNLQYRVFTTTVAIRSAKWSQ